MSALKKLRRSILSGLFLIFLILAAYLVVEYWKMRGDKVELVDAAQTCEVPIGDIYWSGGDTRYGRILRSIQRPDRYDKIKGKHFCLWRWAHSHNATYTTSELN